DAYEPDGARDAVAVRLEVALPRLVALAVEIHLHTGNDGVEVLAWDRKALDGVGERDPDRMARPPRVDRVELLAPAREECARVARRAVVGDIVRGAAKRVDGAQRAAARVGQEAERPREVRRRAPRDELAVIVRGGDGIPERDGSFAHANTPRSTTPASSRRESVGRRRKTSPST